MEAKDGMPAPGSTGASEIVTAIPARLDALPWTRFHTLVVVALGISWILDGLEVTLAGAVSGALRNSPALHLTEAQIGMAGSAYVAGAVGGAILFGWLTDRLGRKRLFSVTVLVYLAATAATAFSTSFATFALFRFLTGAGIGGEYAAINSAIQELIPARFRGRTDLIVNGSFWIGAALGAVGSIVLLAPGRLPPDAGWRACFAIGAVLGLIVLWLRRFLPESPRWLMIRGRTVEAEAIVTTIEAYAPPPAGSPVPIRLRLRAGSHEIADLVRSLFRLYPRRSALGMVLMTAQAFFYNAIFFTYALVLDRFFAVPADRIGHYLLPFAAGNFLGPLILGHWFDTVGRRPMIAFTYAMSGLLLLATAALFAAGAFSAMTMAAAWSIVFFFASAAASSAYLTVGECFPLEVRALAIATFYVLGTATGGIAGPWLFGVLIGEGQRSSIAWGYGLAAVLMLVAGAIAARWGIAAERRSLEEVAAPLAGLRSNPQGQ